MSLSLSSVARMVGRGHGAQGPQGDRHGRRHGVAPALLATQVPGVAAHLRRHRGPTFLDVLEVGQAGLPQGRSQHPGGHGSLPGVADDDARR